MKISINSEIFEVEENDLTIETEELSDSENKLLVISFSGTLYGKEQMDLLTSALKGTFDFVIEEKDINIKAKRSHSSHSYQGKIDNDTEVNYNVTVKEHHETPSKGMDFMGKAFMETLYNWARTRSISELLVDKGIITKEEYENKLQYVMKRDLENMKNYILGEKDTPYPQQESESSND